MTLILELLAKHWKAAVIGLLAIAIGIWIETLRIERDHARNQFASAQVQVKSLAADIATQNAAVNQLKKAATEAQKRSATALKEVQGKVDAWEAAAKALAGYKRTPQIVTKYHTVKVVKNECEIAKGLAVDAWAASRVRSSDAKDR